MDNLITVLVIGPVPTSEAPVPTDADVLLTAVLDPNAAADPVAELQLLAFDDQEVAARLDMMFGPFFPGVPEAMVDAVKQAAATALPGDDPIDFVA